MRLAPFWAAFSFLSRLAPARTFSSADMAAAARCFPLVGAVLGLLATVPVLLALLVRHGSPNALTAASGPVLSPALLALSYIGLLFWATRGLHWDGLADCFDAWGSGQRGEAFQRILKDSRVGSFGVMGMALTLCAMLAALIDLLAAPGVWIASPAASSLSSPALLQGLPAAPRLIAALVLAPMAGRTAILVLPALLPPHPVSTLGRIVAPGCTPRLAAMWGSVWLTLWGWTQGAAALILVMPLTGFCLFFLWRLARREKGFNGDFLGCACLLTETAALVAATV